MLSGEIALKNIHCYYYYIDIHIGIHLLFIIIKFIDRHYSALVKFYLIYSNI